MKIYYMVPFKDFGLHSQFYISTRNLLLSRSATLLGDWIEDYTGGKESEKNSESSKFYINAVKNIAACDLTIFDVTVSSTSIGNQITNALNMQKPTLVLSNGTHKRAGDLFIAGAEAPELKVSTYSDNSNLTAAITNFLDEYADARKYRLNLALGRSQQQYILWAAKHYHKSKTEIVNAAINKVIEADSSFQRFREEPGTQ